MGGGGEAHPGRAGGLAIDEFGMPVAEYSPPAEEARSARLPAGHIAGNRTVKLLVSGGGLAFPFLWSDRVISYSGNPWRSASLGAGSLFLGEGGKASPVVGPDHPMAERSDVQRAKLLLFPTGFEKVVDGGGLLIRQRLLLSMTDVPAVVTMYSVENRSEGNRWVTLWDVWHLSPMVLEPSLAERPLTSRLLSALRSRPPEDWDNSFVRIEVEKFEGRAQVSFPWLEAQLRRRCGKLELPAIPSLCFLGMTRNVTVGRLAPSDAFLQVGPELLGAPDTAASARICAEVKFQPGPGETQAGAVICWLGELAEAKVGLRRLMPLSMLQSNEGLMMRKRARLAVERHDPAGRQGSLVESAWQAGMLQVAPWRTSGGKRAMLWAGGRGTFGLESTGPDVPLSAAAAVPLSYVSPRLAAELLVSAGTELLERIDRCRMAKADFSDLLPDLLWVLWAASEHVAATAAAGDGAFERCLRCLAEATADLLQEPSQFGPHGLLIAAAQGLDGLAYELPGLPDRRSGQVESLLGTSLMCVALEGLAGQMTGQMPDLCGVLHEIAASGRQALAGVCNGTHYPRWVAGACRIGDRRVFLEHHCWLLALEPPLNMVALTGDHPAGLRQSSAGVLDVPASTPALPASTASLSGRRLPVQSTMFDGRSSRSCLEGRNALAALLMDRLVRPGEAGARTIDEAFDEVAGKAGVPWPAPAIDPLLTALLIGGLGKTAPSLAAELFERMSAASMRAVFPSGWNLAFEPAGRLPLRPSDGASAKTATDPAPGWAASAGPAGCVAACLARVKLFGLRATDRGLALRADLLDRYELLTPVLSLTATPGRISGQWEGLGAQQTLLVQFASAEEAAAWAPDGELSWSRVPEESGLLLVAPRGVRWALRRQQ